VLPELVDQAAQHPDVFAEVMDSAPLAVAIDFCLMAALLVVGKILRTRLRVLQNWFVPPSVVAGAFGLLLGPQVLDVLPFSTMMGKYAWLLVVVLFASFPIGQKPSASARHVINKVGSTFFYNFFAETSQFALGAVLCLFVMRWFWPDLHEGFAWLLPAGFVGGHGYSTAIGSTLERFGLKDAVSIGMTMATVGLLLAIIGGVLLIRQATGNGYTRLVKERSTLPGSLRTGLIPPGERSPLGEGTVSPMSIDPLAWHSALVLSATLGGILITQWLAGISWLKIGGKPLYLPEICTALVAAMVLQRLLRVIKLSAYVDKKVVTRIASSVSDYMVGFGVASIKISVVMTFWQPLLFLIVVGLLWIAFNLYVLAPRMLNNYWFERGIFTYGYSTGVVAFGITLLRMIDPEFRSEALEDYGLAYVLIAPVELCLVALSPLLYMTYPMITTLVLVGATVVALVGARLLGFWYRADKLAGRPGEQKDA
jgi:ESS family glutamate:Na+ symporter